MNGLQIHPFHQIIPDALLMCPPAVAAAPGGIIGVLDHWQTLTGSIFGGLLGVIGALIVATMAVRRQRWIAATGLLPDTQQLMAAHASLEDILNDPDSPVEEWQANQWRAAQLLQRRPVLRTLHETTAVTQLSDVDARLSAHLFHCQMTHEGFERTLEDFRLALNASRAPMPAANIAVSEEGLQRRAKRVRYDWDLCAEHAAMATYFMDRLVFNRWPNVLHRIRMRLLPSDLDRRSRHLLKTGEPLESKEEQ